MKPSHDNDVKELRPQAAGSVSENDAGQGAAGSSSAVASNAMATEQEQLSTLAQNSPQANQAANLQDMVNKKNGKKGEGAEKSEKEEGHYPEHETEKGKFTKEQKRQIKESMAQAYRLALLARDNVSDTNPLYRKWLDGKTTGFLNTFRRKWRLNKVKKIFSKMVTFLIKEKTIFKDYELDDGEKDTTFAYVYTKSKLRNIYLGGAFWSAPMVGRDSKAGTIIHELTHMLSGTKDHTYELDEMLELASKKPHKAIDNANNLEYYAEDQ